MAETDNGKEIDKKNTQLRLYLLYEEKRRIEEKIAWEIEAFTKRNSMVE